MLTPISTKIEEFEDAVSKKWGSYGMSWNNDDTRNFLRTALEQRDNEWREMVEGKRKEECDCLTQNGEWRCTQCDNWKYNQALDDIITKSKDTPTTTE